MALSRLEKQVARLATDLPRPDPALQMLLRLTDLDEAGYVGLVISVVAGGKVIRGNLMGSRSYFERLDEDLEKAMTNFAAGLGEEDSRRQIAEQWRDAISGHFASAYRRGLEEEKGHDEALDQISDERDTERDSLLLDDLPDDVAETDIALNPPPLRAALTLENAVIITPPIREDAIGTIRIATAQIDAWWLNADGPDEPESED
jgi:hypothetical protein